MISLTYLSTAVTPFDEDELEQLLEHSRRRNGEAGLTGMLLYAEGHFIQTLEGEEDVVDEAYGRISADPRHRDVFVAWREGVEERAFPDWSMGFDRLAPEEAAELDGMTDFLRRQGEPGGRASGLGTAGIFHRVFRDRMR